MILVNVEANSAPDAVGGVGLHARVSSPDWKPDLERQVARMTRWSASAGLRVVRLESEVGSGMDGTHSGAKRLLADPRARKALEAAGHG
ncbi:hypothetical protein SRB17_77990 [Streptomyces sp. RB17]|uniref:recombinase family protein n=1 Tax=Streptomyces sp. RB17 TaxID=2585197 RepID=UPI001297787D|nr:recombinase family protein [Streptomyces sp. RB17]MQY39772.1 hypothetical protein [Streptomyces sp. RB17]